MLRRVSTLMLMLPVLLLAACDLSAGSGQEPLKYVPPPTVPPTEAPVATPTHTPYADPPTPTAPPTLVVDTSKVKKQLALVEANTAKMRGLKAKRAVPEHFISSDQMAYNMTQETLSSYSHDQAVEEAKRLYLLLMIDDPSIDFRQMEIDFSGQAVLGYYDHRTKELFVRSDDSTLSPASQETLAHEFVHNLQDQYHDLSKFFSNDADSDQQMALRALVEGDATISGLFYASKYMSKGDFNSIFDGQDMAPPVPGRAPVYLQEGWQFPYTLGSRFVVSLGEPYSFKGVEAAFANPPKSTEQIMHPEKFLGPHRDDPLPVEIPPLTDTLGAGWTFKETNTLGEFDLSVMLRENYMEKPEAAAGWGGARYALYENGDNSLVYMGSRWDTPKDAVEFRSALEQSFKLFQQHGTMWNDSRRVFSVAKSGDQIVFVCGTDTAAVQKVLASLKP